MWKTLVLLFLCTANILTHAIINADDILCTRLFAGHDCITPLDLGAPIASDASICVLLDLPNVPASGETATRTFIHTDLAAEGFTSVQPCLAPQTTEATGPKVVIAGVTSPKHDAATTTEAPWPTKTIFVTTSETSNMPEAVSSAETFEPIFVTAGEPSDLQPPKSATATYPAATKHSEGGLGIRPVSSSGSSTPYQ
jgi:hypothetical protein